MRHRPVCRAAASSPDLIILIQPLTLYASTIAHRTPCIDNKLDTSGFSNSQLTRFRQHLAAIARPSYNRGLYADNSGGSNNGPSVAADINCDDEEDCGNGGLEGSGKYAQVFSQVSL